MTINAASDARMRGGSWCAATDVDTIAGVCTLAVYLHVFAAHPVVVAANRDEWLTRPSRPPELLRTGPGWAFGGRDAVAGGTWLGVNAQGLVAGLLNRRTDDPPDPARRSRGQLCLDALAAVSAERAATWAAAEPAGRYNAFNLLVADAAGGFVVTQAADDAPRLLRLEAGLHLLSNLDVDDPRCPRIAASQRAFAAAGEAFAAGAALPAFVTRLQRVLAEHATRLDPRGPGSVCVHADGYGTRAASVIVSDAAGRPAHWYHADGPPCRTPLAAVALPR
jgi:uncharacterized protein with NRDE domain